MWSSLTAIDSCSVKNPIFKAVGAHGSVRCGWTEQPSMVSVGKLLFADTTCTSCGLCARQCPCGAILMKGAKPKTPFWTHHCEACMRCMGYCKTQSIQASHSWMVSGGGHTWQYSLRMTTNHFCPGPDVVVCEPQGGATPSHPMTYWYDVTPVDGGRCDFHVGTLDPNQGNYSNWVEPQGWVHYVFQLYGKWWVCWSNPQCTNPITTTFRFQFDNPSGRSWSDWATGTSGT